MKKFVPYLGLAAGLLLLAACSSPPDSGESAQSEGTADPAEESEVLSVEELSAGEWVAETIAGEPLVEDSRVTILFSLDGGVSGSGGCNNFTGSYEVDGQGLSFGPLANTMMACVDAIMEQERRFHEALESAGIVRVDDETLILQTEVGGPASRFQRAVTG